MRVDCALNCSDFTHTYTAADGGGTARELDALTTRTLTLKLHARVLLTKNIDLSRQLCNGSAGVVVGFETGTSKVASGARTL